MFTFANEILIQIIAMENEQINIILQNEGLSASQFAEKIDVQRSMISHIQNNRNKVSLEMVKKIHKTFPHIRLAWLIDFEGDYRETGASSSPAPVYPSSVDSSGMGGLFDDQLQGMLQSTSKNNAENKKNPDERRDDVVFSKENDVKSPLIPPKNSINQVDNTFCKPARQIVEMKVFYDDGTYETFNKR